MLFQYLNKTIMGVDFSLLTSHLVKIDINRPIIIELRHLVGCKRYLGSKQQILDLYYEYSHDFFDPSYYLPQSPLTALLRIPRNSQIPDIFSVNGSINILEILVVIIIYSSLYWKHKVKLAYTIFGSLEAARLTSGEIMKLLLTFATGICRAIGSEQPDEFCIHSVSYRILNNKTEITLTE